MKTKFFFKYFKYEFLRNLKALVFLFAAFFLFYIIPILSLPSNSVDVSLNGIIVCLMLCCLIIPIYQNRYHYNKRLSERNNSSPITKRTLVFVNYLVGLVNVFIAFVTIFVIATTIVIILTHGALSNIYFVPYLLVVLLVGFCIYTINYFISYKANSFIDGLLFVLGYTFILSLVMKLMKDIMGHIDSHFISYFNTNLKPGSFISVSSLFDYSAYFSDLIINASLYNTVNESPSLSLGTLIMSLGIIPVATIACLVVMYFTSVNESSQRAGEISNTFMGYRLLINAYTFFVCASIFKQSETGSFFISFFLCSFMYLTLNIIHKRKFRFTWQSALAFNLSFIVGIIFSLIFFKDVSISHLPSYF